MINLHHCFRNWVNFSGKYISVATKHFASQRRTPTHFLRPAHDRCLAWVLSMWRFQWLSFSSGTMSHLHLRCPTAQCFFCGWTMFCLKDFFFWSVSGEVHCTFSGLTPSYHFSRIPPGCQLNLFCQALGTISGLWDITRVPSHGGCHLTTLHGSRDFQQCLAVEI